MIIIITDVEAEAEALEEDPDQILEIGETLL